MEIFNLVGNILGQVSLFVVSCFCVVAGISFIYYGYRGVRRENPNDTSPDSSFITIGIVVLLCTFAMFMYVIKLIELK